MPLWVGFDGLDCDFAGVVGVWAAAGESVVVVRFWLNASFVGPRAYRPFGDRLGGVLLFPPLPTVVFGLFPRFIAATTAFKYVEHRKVCETWMGQTFKRMCVKKGLTAFRSAALRVGAR